MKSICHWFSSLWPCNSVNAPTNNLFLLGAGYTKSVFNDAPLNDQLVDALLDLNPSSPLQQLSKKYQTKDIEILLTKLDLDIQKSKFDHDIRNKINNELATFFQKYRFKIEILGNNKWLEKFALMSFRENDVIVNLNYECFLEGLLDHFKIWSPHKGYGSIDNPLIDDSCVNPKNIQILKIHGSENFTEQPYYDKPECSAVGFEFNEGIFPRSASNSFLGPRSIPLPASHKDDEIKPYIIAPSYVKIPKVEITYLMIDALEAAKKSEKIIVIGCGLRPEDSFIWLLLTSFLKNPEWRKRRIIIISPDAKKLGNRIRQHWGVNVDNNLIEIPSKLEEVVDDLIKLL